MCKPISQLPNVKRLLRKLRGPHANEHGHRQVLLDQEEKLLGVNMGTVKRFFIINTNPFSSSDELTYHMFYDFYSKQKSYYTLKVKKSVT